MIAKIKQAKNMLTAMQDPQSIIRMAQNNPAVQQVINQYGSVDGAITALCRQKGIDPQEFMDALK